MIFTNHIEQQNKTAKASAAKTPFFQAKLSVNQPGDAFEQEADSVADKVMQMSNHSTATNFFNPSPVSIQRKCQHCEEEDRQQKLQRKESSNSNTPGQSTEDYVSTLQSGRALSAAERSFFEPRMGYDFSTVRVHTDGKAQESAKSVNALAYTHTNNIVFGAGQYNPGTNEGKKLMAHELTHVVQQQAATASNAPVQRKQNKEHGELKEVPADVKGNCDGVADVTPALADEQKIKGVEYALDSDKLSPAIIKSLNNFAAEWHKKGGNEKIDIFGYASTDGPEAHNWDLSCRRANAVKQILLKPTDGTAGITEGFIITHAQGETNKFGADWPANRVATIVSTVKLNPSPPTPPAPVPNKSVEKPKSPQEKICGPDATAEKERIWTQIQNDFWGWDAADKTKVCTYLVSPIMPNYRHGGGWGPNIDAFDTKGLFIDSYQFQSPCAMPGMYNDQDENGCGGTVQIGDQCWLAGTVNYGTFGIMMKLCHDWTSGGLPIKPMPTVLPQDLFSPENVAALVSAYKIVNGENPARPLEWALGAYYLGPGATVNFGNRPDCSLACKVPILPFDYYWQPIHIPK